MTVTSIGSSFSYIRPEAAGRTPTAAAPEATETSETRSASSPSAPQATGSARPSVADDLRALMVKAQEASTSPPSPSSAARAYAGR